MAIVEVSDRMMFVERRGNHALPAKDAMAESRS